MQRGPEHCDVAILGGGLAGLTLAIQLLQTRPSARVLVLEKRTLPAPEATFKVGESLVEVGAWYLREVIGLGAHLSDEQLPKFGLRFFMSSGDNRDIAQRLEFGPLRVSPIPFRVPFTGLALPTYNVDRGRLENHLAERARAVGATIWHNARVCDLTVHRAGAGGVRSSRAAATDSLSEHVIAVQREGARREVRARWLIDASGRAGLLKRHLQLAQQVDHQVDARWFRLSSTIDPDDWSENTDWRLRTFRGLRRLSTNHLMGAGYWVWMIPLATGGTSVGVVTDARMHPANQLNRFERVLAWLHRHEPQCARAVEERRADLQDFKIMRGGAYGCRTLLSRDRWAITGEAGVHLDPLYSPGADLIAVGNTVISDLVRRDLAGESIAGAVHFGETLLQSMFQQYLLLYRGQYAVMGNAAVMIAKVTWDTAFYFGYNTLLFQHGKLCDRRFLLRVRNEIDALMRLQGRMQSTFPQWAARASHPDGPGFVDQMSVSFLCDFYMTSKPPRSDDELHERLRRNVRILEELATQLTARAGGRMERSSRRGQLDLGADMERICF